MQEKRVEVVLGKEKDFKVFFLPVFLKIVSCKNLYLKSRFFSIFQSYKTIIWLYIFLVYIVKNPIFNHEIRVLKL